MARIFVFGLFMGIGEKYPRFVALQLSIQLKRNRLKVIVIRVKEFHGYDFVYVD